MHSTILNSIEGIWRITSQSPIDLESEKHLKELVFNRIQNAQSIRGWFVEKKREGSTQTYSKVIPFICRLQTKSALELHFQFGKNLFSESYLITVFKPGYLCLQRMGGAESLKLEKI